jgi:hypothetical protein
MKRLANSATAVHREAVPITILAAYRIALNEAKMRRASQKRSQLAKPSRRITSSTRATFGRLIRLRWGRIVGMKASDRIRIVAWACLLSGFSLVVWQAASGNGSDMLFNIGVMAMITGSVLRVYGKYSRSNRRVDVPRKPPENPASNGCT